MPDSRFSLPNLFGKYSLPSVMGRLGHRIGGLFHHDNGGDLGNYPVSQVGGLTQQPFSTYGNFGTSGFTDPSVSGGDAPLGDNPFVNSQTPQQPQGNPFGSGTTGNTSGGTLGGGTPIDPSDWGSLGFGADNVGDSARFYNQFGRPGEGSGFGGRGLIGSGFFRTSHQPTGGNLPAQGYDSSGINPGGMYTGGNLPAQGGMATGGGLPPQSYGMGTGGNDPAHPFGLPSQPIFGGKRPPGGLMR